MKKVATLFVLMLCCCRAEAQQGVAEFVQYLETMVAQHYTYLDINPSQQEGVDECNNLVKKALNCRTSNERDALCPKALELLDDNSIGLFEDSPDVRRMACRRSMCFSTLALLSDVMRCDKFIEDAKHSLIENIEADLLAYDDILLIDCIYLLCDYCFAEHNRYDAGAVAYCLKRLQQEYNEHRDRVLGEMFQQDIEKLFSKYLTNE